MRKRRELSFPLREDELRTPVRSLFPPDQFFCKNEVPFGLKRIDMLFRRRNGKGEIIAVELKLTKWKKAIWQAATNRQVATFSYVALPSKTAIAVDRELMASLGLGLIVADTEDEARVDLQPKRSRYVNGRIAAGMSDLLAV